MFIQKHLWLGPTKNKYIFSNSNMASFNYNNNHNNFSAATSTSSGRFSRQQSQRIYPEHKDKAITSLRQPRCRIIILTSSNEFISLYNRDYNILKRNLQLKMDFDKIKYDTSTLIGKVASLMNTLFSDSHKKYGNIGKYLYTIITSKDDVKCDFVSYERFWLYDTKKTNFLPKNDESLENLHNIVKKIVDYEFSSNKENKLFLNNNLSHVAAFFIMFLTTPHYYYIDNIKKQNRYGIQRQWSCPIMEKRFNPPKKQEKKEHNKYKNKSFREECILPKQHKQKEEIKYKILSLIKEVNPGFDEKKLNDMFLLTSEMGHYTECCGDFYLGNNKAKKLNKSFQELQKLMKVIAKSGSASKNFGGITTETGSTIMFKKVREHKNKDSLSHTSQSESQKNKYYHEEEENDDIPDNWEDVDLDDFAEDDNTAW